MHPVVYQYDLVAARGQARSKYFLPRGGCHEFFHGGNRSLRRIVLSILCWLSVTGGYFSATTIQAAESAATQWNFSERHMGVEVKLLLYAADEATATCAAKAVYARFAELDRTMSDYKADSELSQLSQTSPHTQPHTISNDLFAVLSRGQELAKQTDGAFDVTVGPLVRLWRRSRRSGQLPTPARLDQARAATGYQHLVLNSKHRTAQLQVAGMRLDLGGIGMGFAVDEAMKVLAKQNITSALIDASGDMAASDPPPGKPGWRVGIVPLDVNAPPSQYLWLKHAALATSGDAYQFVEVDGKRFSHIVDPQTGLGLTHRVAVTVVAPDCTTADSLATALCIMNVDRGLTFADKQPGVAALFLTESAGKPTTYESSRWKALPLERENAPKPVTH